jgi:hypothetical protein
MCAGELDIPDMTEEWLARINYTNTIEILIQIVALPMRQKHSKLTVLEGGDAVNIRHTHLAIRFSRPAHLVRSPPSPLIEYIRRRG